MTNGSSMNEFIYKPDNYPGPVALDAIPSKECDEYQKNSKVCVKFANNITYLESFLKKHNIEYKDEDLEDMPLGRGYVIRRDEPIDDKKQERKEMKILNDREVFTILMRRLNEIAIRMPRKESEKVLYIMSQLENLNYFPGNIRKEEDYQNEE